MQNIRVWFAISLAIVVAALVSPKAAADHAPTADEIVVAKGGNQFALELYGKLRDQQGNLFLSPFSIRAALAMTYAGARGETEAQMAQVLHLPLDQKRLHPAFAALIRHLDAEAKKQGYQLSVANALWGQKGYRLLDEFLATVGTNYGGRLREVDFVGATEEARQRINEWVETETQGKIKDLIRPRILDSGTRLVLTNAIYFKGQWALPFRKDRTKGAPFTLMGGKRVEVPMMNQVGEFSYMEGERFQALELPYVGEALSMTIFLPRDVSGLPSLEKSLTANNLAKWWPRFRKRKVFVAFPKFKVTSQFRLDDTLRAMGMPAAFSMADFSGINGRRDLFISAVLHKAFVDVSEEGTEAAAATAVVMKGVAAGAVFRADHPFVFMIRDKRANTILFVGRVVDPTR